MKDIALLPLGIAGILLHSLIKLYQLKKSGSGQSLQKYFSDEYLSMLISLIIVVVALVCKKEILQLDIAGDIAGNYLGLVFVAIGYMGQFVLITFMGKVSAKAGIKDDTIPAIAMLIGLTLLCSCSASHKLNSLDRKHKDKLINWCAQNCAVHDSVHEQVLYQPGETVYVPGETVYANCDSAYQSALDEAARLGIKIVVKKVAIPCPPSTIRIDTVTNVKYVQILNDAKERQLQADNAKLSTLASALNKTNRNRNIELLALLTSMGIYGYFRIKSGYVRKAEKLL